MKNRRSSSFLAFCRTKMQLGPKMAIFEPQQEGSNLDQIQKYFVWCIGYWYMVYWDQYQGFKTPAFWLNVFFKKPLHPNVKSKSPHPSEGTITDFHYTWMQFIHLCFLVPGALLILAFYIKFNFIKCFKKLGSNDWRCGKSHST
jgi:hypothetical protein